jgi:hypothetical protein
MAFPRRSIASQPAAALVAALALMTAVPAHATLGGGVASIEADRARLKGQVHLTSVAGVTVHEIITASGTRVREYLTPDGAVFAFTWRGPYIPNMRQLLGSYYEQYAHGAAETRPAGTRRLSVQLPGLVVESSGHMRAFFGRAWDPALLPQSFSLSDLK